MALVAKRFGGDEKSPAEFCRLVETISQADGSAGWVASFGIGGVYLAALPADTLAKLYADGPDVVFAGGIFPPQPAQQVDGGLEVKGRWSFASGCMGAEVLGVGILPKNGDTVGLPRMAVMPRANARIEPNWDVMGLLATGSTQFPRTALYDLADSLAALQQPFSDDPALALYAEPAPPQVAAGYQTFCGT